jgi:hypothetical protein
MAHFAKGLPGGFRMHPGPPSTIVMDLDRMRGHGALKGSGCDGERLAQRASV